MKILGSVALVAVLLLGTATAGCFGSQGQKAPQKADLLVVFTNRMPHTMDINGTVHAATNEVAWHESKQLTADQTVTAGHVLVDFGDYTFIADAHGIQCVKGPVHVDATTQGWQVTVNPDGSVTCPVATK